MGVKYPIQHSEDPVKIFTVPPWIIILILGTKQGRHKYKNLTFCFVFILRQFHHIAKAVFGNSPRQSSDLGSFHFNTLSAEIIGMRRRTT